GKHCVSTSSPLGPAFYREGRPAPSSEVTRGRRADGGYKMPSAGPGGPRPRHAARQLADEGVPMLQEFKEFINRGNVLDLAVAVVIGAAFGKIVTSLVDGVIMPPIGMLLGNVDFSSLFVVLDSTRGVP